MPVLFGNDFVQHHYKRRTLLYLLYVIYVLLTHACIHSLVDKFLISKPFSEVDANFIFNAVSDAVSPLEEYYDRFIEQPRKKKMVSKWDSHPTIPPSIIYVARAASL